jgi:glyoxylase-like metal-dependent hydrolase (beta-lactamase superfamily II)
MPPTIERSLHPSFLSNAYLVYDEPGGTAVIVDSGAPPEPLLESIERNGLDPTHLLLTHHHHDHVERNATYKERFGVEILAHPLEAARLDDVDRAIEPGEAVLEAGDLRIGALHTPGHTDGMLSFVVDGKDVFTGDTLFRGSVGGVKAPGATTFADLKSSVMDVLMALPPETRLHPGHTDPTTVGEEWESNPFVRLWRGLDPEGDERCTVWERDATLVLWAPDYDGGHKAWIRWDDSGEDDIVPGSQVARS